MADIVELFPGHTATREPHRIIIELEETERCVCGEQLTGADTFILVALSTADAVKAYCDVVCLRQAVEETLPGKD